MNENPPWVPGEPTPPDRPPADPGPLPDVTSEADLQAQAAVEDDGLRVSLGGLSQQGTGQRHLSDVLTRVAERAVLAIAGADGVGLTLLGAGQPDMIVASAPFVGQVDAIQYGIGQGPGITAVEQGCTVRSGSLETDPRWPQFGPLVGRLGVHSVLSIPLLISQAVIGAMNVYAHDRDAFDEHAVLIGELFAIRAASAVQNALVLAQARHLATQLQAALTSRSMIDQALGIVMSRFGCGQDEAVDRLRHISQQEDQKLHTVAQNILEEAIR